MINIHCRVTLSIEAMFQHKAKCSQFLSVGEPASIRHPCWICWALSTYHQKHWTTGLVEGIIYKVPLRGNNRVRDIQEVETNREEHISGVAVCKMSQNGSTILTDGHMHIDTFVRIKQASLWSIDKLPYLSHSLTCFHTLVSAPLKWSSFCVNHCSSNRDPCLVSLNFLNLK